jgi:hypothetical protein
MNKHKLLYLFCTAVIMITFSACKKQLNVGNPNSPTIQANVNSESGLISLAKGGVYTNGFVNGDGWLGDSYFSLPWGYQESMADVVGAEASNNQISVIGLPDYAILDNGTKVSNPSPQIALIRTYNTRPSTGAGNNVLYYHWLNMYALNAACNLTLSLVPGISFSGDAASRANTLKAWCYWWKGYAYASIGTMYYSGLVIDSANGASNKYLLKDAVLARSNYYLNLASSTLSSITSASDYSAVLGQLIPSFCQVGNGGVLTTAMWIRNINTLLARNIVLNKLSPFVNGNPAATIAKSSTGTMSAADWNSVLTYATNGIKKGDYVFTGRSVAATGFISAGGGTVSALTTGANQSTLFKISERFIQNFKTGDARLSSNFYKGGNYHSTFGGTRYSLKDSLSSSTTYVYGGTLVGQYELFIAGSYEENQLMLAEANIRLGNIDAGLAYVDAVRAYQGSGDAPVANTGLTLAQALTELTSERRVSLVFRGLSFYDSRRWGWTYDISNGGGSYGNSLLTTSDVLNTNVTFNYNFMDYWDVPADESVLNPPAAGSAPVVNPNF